MSEPLTRDEVRSLREWLEHWGPVGHPNWSDKTGETVPVAKVTMVRILDAAERGIQGFEMDAISPEAHGVPESDAIVGRIVDWMRTRYPMNRHAQEWADAIERREWVKEETKP